MGKSIRREPGQSKKQATNARKADKAFRTNRKQVVEVERDDEE